MPNQTRLGVVFPSQWAGRQTLILGDSDKGSDDMLQESSNASNPTCAAELESGASNASTVVSGGLCVNETVRSATHIHCIVLEKNAHTQHRSSSLDTFYPVEGIDEVVKQDRQVFPLISERLSGLGAGCVHCSKNCTSGHGWCLERPV